MSDVETEVVVVGAGPAGLTMANLLGRRGVEVVLVERNADTVSESRAAVLNDEGLRALYMTGLGAELVAGMIIGPGHTNLDRKGRRRFTVGPAWTPVGYPDQAWIHQPDVERTLAAGIRRLPSCELWLGHEITAVHEEGSAITVTGLNADGPFRLRSAYVVGADGASSTLRRCLGIGFAGSTFQERWVVLDLEEDATGLPPGSIFGGDPRRPYITAQLPGRRRRWEFLAFAGEDDAELLRDESIAALIGAVTDAQRAGRVARRTVYRFHARQAERWRVGRTLLVGDAAHVMPPFAGQGLNSGLRGVANLAWKLHAVLRGAPDELLDTYEQERRPQITRATRTAIAIGRVDHTTSHVAAAARDTLTRAAAVLPAARRALERGRFLPWPQYTEGAFIRDGSGLSANMLPGLGATPGGDPARTDEALGEGWAVVGCAPSYAWALTEDACAMIDALGACVVRVDEVPGGDIATHREAVCVDRSGRLRRWLGNHWQDLLLVRPDRFVFGVAPRHELAHLLERAMPLATKEEPVTTLVRCPVAREPRSRRSTVG